MHEPKRLHIPGPREREKSIVGGKVIGRMSIWGLDAASMRAHSQRQTRRCKATRGHGECRTVEGRQSGHQRGGAGRRGR